MLFDRCRILFVPSRVPTGIPCNPDFGPQVAPTIALDLRILIYRSTAKGIQLRIHRLRLVRRQCFQYRKDVPGQPGGRIRQGENYDTTVPQNVLDHFVVVQPPMSRCQS